MGWNQQGKENLWTEEAPEDNPSPRGLKYGLPNFLDLHHVNSLQALLSLGDFELDLVAFMKNLESFLFNG